MHPRYWSISALLAIVLLTAAGAQKDTPVADGDDDAEELKSLLTERRDTLRQLVTVVGDQYRAGRSSLESVVRASDQLLIAELDLAEGRDSQLGFYKQRVNLLRDFEKVSKTRFQAGQVGQEDVLSVQAARLSAEIELFRAQSSGE